MAAPLLTVTLTNYNYGRFVGRAIESVLAQSFRDFELLVVDNASTDNSLEIIQRYANTDPRIRVITHEENQGLTASLREACDLARGRYRVHLDADDWVVNPDAFALQLGMLENNPGMAFVYSPIALYDNDGNELHVQRAHKTDTIQPGEQAVDYALRTYVMHSGPMMRMDAYRAFGGYDMSVRFNVDISLATKLCAQGSVGYIATTLYAFCQHGPSLTSTAKEQLLLEECIRVIDDALKGPFAQRIPNAKAIRHRAVGHRLLLNPRLHIFAGRYRTGWGAYVENLRKYPAETLFQKELASLALRTVAGGSGYAAVLTLMSTIAHSRVVEDVVQHLPV